MSKLLFGAALGSVVAMGFVVGPIFNTSFIGFAVFISTVFILREMES